VNNNQSLPTSKGWTQSSETKSMSLWPCSKWTKHPEPSFPFLHFWRGGFILHVSEDAADELLGDGDLTYLERSATALLLVPCVVVADNAWGEDVLLEGATGSVGMVARWLEGIWHIHKHMLSLGWLQALVLHGVELAP
jgi:hypothetical protein